MCAAAATAHAGSRSWVVCGGNAFNTCASVDLTVGGQNVTIRVWNLSGFYGSYANTVFTGVGFENIGNVAVVMPNCGGSPCSYATATMSGPVRGTNTPSAWQLRNNTQIGGGVTLDVVSTTGSGVDNSIASGCANNSKLPGGSNQLWMNPCALPTGTSDPGYIQISFTVTGTWDLASTYLLVKGQNGPAGKSTECITGGANANCGVVPEPVTMLLLGSGLAGMGGFGLARRRRRDELGG